MTTANLETFSLPRAGDEGWRGTALRALEGVRFVPEAATTESVRFSALAQAVRQARPAAVWVDGSTGQWRRTDGKSWDSTLGVKDDAFGLAKAPRWAGWTDGFLWSARLQEQTNGRGLVVDVRTRTTLVVVANGGGPSGLRVTVAPGAELELVDLRENAGNDVLAASRIRLDVGAGATVRWFRAVAGEGARVDDVEATLQANARLEWANVGLAGRLTRTDARVFLAGKDAAFVLNGLSLVDGTAVADFRVGIEHGAPATKSQQEYRTLANRQGSSLFHGRVVIPPGNPGVEAHQQAPSLLLSRGARVQSRPQLEIHTDEVQCSHGSTVGELDATALFYLRSRGIDAESARKLLVEGFARAVLEPWSALVDVRSLDLLWQGGVA